MDLIEVYVETCEESNRAYYLGGLLFDCGLKIQGIHFWISGNIVKVNYPAIRDKYNIFHPSFQIIDNKLDRAIKNVLKSALEKLKRCSEKMIFGYRKEICNKEWWDISEDDFEWNNEKSMKEYQFSSLQQFEGKVVAVINKKNLGKLQVAYVEVRFDKCFSINNVKVYQDREMHIRVQFPGRGEEKAVAFMSEKDQNWIETYIINQFLNDVEPILFKGISEEELLFRVLWMASENGYILQSKIPEILEQNGIDWKTTYQVEEISELVEKMNFMSIQRLESLPEHYVNWVAISYEKDPEPVVIINKNIKILSDDIKEELHGILLNEYRRNGKIILSRIIPYLREEYPETLEKLPKLKLKTILQKCDFVQFEGGPMPPIYVHILGGNTVIIQQEPCNADSEPDKHELLPELKEDFRYSEMQLIPNNPFKFVPNTKLMLEQDLPGTVIPKITVNAAMKKLQTMANLGQFDSMDLEILYWVSNLQYSKATFLYDLIISGFIALPIGKKISRDKLNTRLMRLYKVGFIQFYKLCSLDENGNICGKTSHRLQMITPHGRTQLRTIGRQSHFEPFMTLENAEKINKKLSINQWFTKFIVIFKDAFYHFDSIVVAKIAEANAAKIPLVIRKEGIPVFVSAFKRGKLHMQEILSGEFAYWVKRVSNLLNNYSELYIEGHQITFMRKPLIIIICEDVEHCSEVHNEIVNAVLEFSDKSILDNLWLAADLDVYNDFLHAHFSIDSEGERIPMSLSEFLGVEIDKGLEEQMDFANEQNPEEDKRILKELEYEEKQVMLSLAEENQLEKTDV